MNFFIDPTDTTQLVNLEGWNLVIADAVGNRPGQLNCKLCQSDNSLCLQPQGAQVKIFHGVQGVHSRFVKYNLISPYKIFSSCPYLSKIV